MEIDMRSNKVYEISMEIPLIGEIVAEYQVVSNGSPAILYPIERAQPEEYPEIEVQSVKLRGVEILEALTNEEIDAVEEFALDNLSEQDEPDYDENRR
jgi:hypothetical protein